MPNRPHVCVFCGSSPGVRPEFRTAARRVGDTLARLGIGLVYGGGRVGLMGVVADAALAGGGQVVGVIPEALASKEIAHGGLTELHIVQGMHERKAMMAARAGAFLTLPGGIGTYEEFFEILSWALLGLHRKPMGLLNVGGYFDPLLALLRHAADEGFVGRDDLGWLAVEDDPEALAGRILDHRPPPPRVRWIDLEDA